MTGCDFTEDVIPMVEVPSRELAECWCELTQIKNLGIKFVLVKDDVSIWESKS